MCESLIETYKYLKKIHISEPIPTRLYVGNYLSDAPRHFIAPLLKVSAIALSGCFWIFTNASRPVVRWADDYQEPQDTLAVFSGSDVYIFKKSISIQYDIFQNLYWYNIDIFKMLVIKERCYSYNLRPDMLDLYFLASFHIITGILFNRKVDWL